MDSAVASKPLTIRWELGWPALAIVIAHKAREYRAEHCCGYCESSWRMVMRICGCFDISLGLSIASRRVRSRSSNRQPSCKILSCSRTIYCILLSTWTSNFPPRSCSIADSRRRRAEPGYLIASDSREVLLSLLSEVSNAVHLAWYVELSGSSAIRRWFWLGGGALMGRSLSTADFTGEGLGERPVDIASGSS